MCCRRKFVPVKFLNINNLLNLENTTSGILVAVNYDNSYNKNEWELIRTHTFF